jgi:pyruvate kinase
MSLGNDYIEANVIVGGAISNHKGVNLPGTILDLSPLTAKDRADLEFGLRLGVDWVALSFVQKPSDMIEARARLAVKPVIVATQMLDSMVAAPTPREPRLQTQDNQ